MIRDLFPTPVGFYSLDREISQEETDFITKQVSVANTGNSRSLDTFVLSNPELSDIKAFAESCLQEYFDAVYCPKDAVKPYITQSWLNYTDKGEYHHKHNHPNSFISGVFYISVDEELDNIHFFNPAHKHIVLPPKEWNHYNSNSWWYGVKSLDLILFPSELTHMVVATESAKTRLSLAFNTYLKGSLGSIDDLTKLDL